jgi:hypothetical protein
MPWAPELFTAPVTVHILERADERVPMVRFFDGVRTGDIAAIVDSFAGVPELHHPIRGRVKGVGAFERFVTDTDRWLAEQRIEVEEVALTYAPPIRGVEEVALHLPGGVDLPVAIVDDRTADERIAEMRVYFSTLPMDGRHTVRAPLLQPDPGLDEPDLVRAYHRALAAGDAEAAAAAFEPDGYVREAAGAIHRGPDAVRALHERMFSGGGIAVEHCAVTDDGHSCALEYNVVSRGETALPPQAAVAVYVRGDEGRLAAARLYDDVPTL